MTIGYHERQARAARECIRECLAECRRQRYTLNTMIRRSVMGVYRARPGRMVDVAPVKVKVKRKARKARTVAPLGILVNKGKGVDVLTLKDGRFRIGPDAERKWCTTDKPMAALEKSLRDAERNGTFEEVQAAVQNLATHYGFTVKAAE